MKRNKIDKVIDEIIEAVLERTDFDVETCGYQDYDVHLFINKNDRQLLVKELMELLK